MEAIYVFKICQTGLLYNLMLPIEVELEIITYSVKIFTVAFIIDFGIFCYLFFGFIDHVINICGTDVHWQQKSLERSLIPDSDEEFKQNYWDNDRTPLIFYLNTLKVGNRFIYLLSEVWWMKSVKTRIRWWIPR